MTSSSKRAWLWVLLLLAGCSGDDFDPYERLNSLRVLAIRSEPVAPGSGETTTLTPLIYPKPGETDLSYAWSWCPLQASAADGARCPVDEAQLAQLGAASGVTVPGYDLGSDATATFTNGLGAELLAQACAGGVAMLPVFDCDQGLPVQIKLTVRSASQQVVAIRTLRLRMQSDAGDTNPSIEGLGVSLDKKDVMELSEDLGDVTPTLPRRVDTPVVAAVSEDVAERYEGADDTGQQVQKREHLVFSWFVESGVLDSGRTSYVEGTLPLDAAEQNLWRPGLLKDYPGDTAKVVLVLRDDRDGVAWRSGVVRLGDEP